MKRKHSFPILLLLTLNINILPQEDSSVILFPSGLNFMPLKANNQEARLGVLYYVSTTNLKVDIGNAVDIISYNLEHNKAKISTGIEFMTYAFSKSYAGKRLQISAVDGFFGGNISFSKDYDNNNLLMRLRIIHNSAHLVDGSYDTNTDTWIDGQKPIPFTKDFGELTIAHKTSLDDFELRYYGGLSYATLIRPDELKRYNFHAGFEISTAKIFGKLLGNDVNLFLAEHFFLDGTSEYFGNQQLMAGAKFGHWDKKGIVFYASYYSGRDIFSSFFDKKISRFGVGFFIDY